MDFDHITGAPAAIVSTLLVLSAPIVAVWLAVVSLPGMDRTARTDAIHGLGYGMIAAGIASLLGRAVYQVGAMEYFQLLTLYVPPVEETLKALAIAMAIGVLTVFRTTRLSLRRCAVTTVAVVAAFATGENVDHMSTLLLGDAFSDPAAMMERLRVRALLPPLGHLAESWVLGAAIWVASWRRRANRFAVLVPGLATAAAVHSLWNASAMWWWPNPWPLLAIVSLSVTGAIGFCLLAVRRQRRERRSRVAPTQAGTGVRQPTGHR